MDKDNYLWIEILDSALIETGRAGFVMANSAGDVRCSELENRKKMLDERAVDVMIPVGPTFFYTVALPWTLWFLDQGEEKAGRKDNGAVCRRTTHLPGHLPDARRLAP